MKLVNCKVGTKVVVKAKQVRSTYRRFHIWNVDQICTITRLPDAAGDVAVTADSDGSTDIGHHTNIRKYKGATA